MKIAVVFLVLLGTVVLGLPFSVSGDRSLTGRVQTFMSYALITTGALLSLLTIFMARSLSDEFVNRQIFLVLTKPIPKWRFVLGKWLGMTVLNAVFLGFAGAAIYGMVHYIKRAYPPLDEEFDRKELENEVLVARHATPATLPDFSRPALAEFTRNMEEGRYADAPDFDPAKEKQRLMTKYEARWRVIGPLDRRVFEFENILCDRSASKQVQVRYKAEVAQYPTDEIFRSYWQFGNPLKGAVDYEAAMRHVVGRFHTIRVPADCVAPDHTLTAVLHNRNPYPGEPQFNNVLEIRASDGIEVLFVVGTFGWNLVRLLLIMLCKLMFLAAVSVLAATVFSFPVACLTSLTVYILAISKAFLSEALDFVTSDRGSAFASFSEFLARAIAFAYEAIHWVVPNFGRYDAVETLVNGRNVSLMWILQAFSELVLLKTVLVLGLAMLLFYRREPAEISF